MSIFTRLNPPVYQGTHKKTEYFEGWYFKMTTSRSSAAAHKEKQGDVLAVIPGISRGRDQSDSHAFIQVFSSRENRSWYIRYPADEFFADTRKFEIRIGNNHFNENGITLAINHETLVLKGTVMHGNFHPFPVTLAAPGIMGWYAYVPRMECFHGVVSLNHIITGTLALNGTIHDFSGGSGYCEKDWGSSFPSAYLWIQSNTFSNISGNTSCMVSVARIHFLGRTFTGFLGFVSSGETLYRFGTYTGASIRTLETTETTAFLRIRDTRHLYEFYAELGPTGHLAAPRQGSMDRTILESLKGTINLTITRLKDQTVVLHDVGALAGIELSEAHTLPIAQHQN